MYFDLGNGARRHRIAMSIELNNLTLVYEKHPAVHHVTATIEAGDLLAVVGPNGSGKSTLLNALAGLMSIEQGCIKGLDPNGANLSLFSLAN